MATEQQRKFGSLPIHKSAKRFATNPETPSKRKLTDYEVEAGMTVEQLREHQMELKAAAAKRREKAT